MVDRIAAVLILCLVVVTKPVQSQSQESVAEDVGLYERLVCLEKEVCSTCLQAASHCRWCADPHFNNNNTSPRCNTEESLLSAGCPLAAVQKQKEISRTVVSDEELSDMTLGDTTVPVQIKPQKMKLSIRPKESQSINFVYRPAKNYPLDLYYLMDLSWSMRDDKDTLVGLRDDLPKALQNLTDNFRIGFGSFADKPLLPYTFIDEKRRQRPCPAYEKDIEVCEPTYNFRHRLSLTNVVDDFINKVRDTDVTANVDNPEGGTDALVQSVLCKKHLGWSTVARKIIVFASDGRMHFAGDGKLGGVIDRNVATCYLDDQGFYFGETTFDYPSLEEIYWLLEEHKVNVIFAVTEDYRNYYERLHELLPLITVVGKLENDSSNIINLVKEGYQDIASVINFEHTADDFFKISYSTNCGVDGGPMIDSHRCEGAQIGKSYQFTVDIAMEACPVDITNTVRTIVINETQLGQQALEIEVELLCECDCEMLDNNAMRKSNNCPKNSKLTCGACQCIDGWSGPNCDCDMSSEASSLFLDSCKSELGDGVSFACSGVGDCICGECVCDRGFSGTYCQCKECDKSPINGLECGGNFYGVCDCGKCACRLGWIGAACDCPLGVERCIAPGDNIPCSGRGDCNCGECRCRVEKDLRYTGDYCEKCANCENRVCTLYENCVVCTILGDCKESQCINENGNLYSTNIITENRAPGTDTNICIARVVTKDLSCDYPYTYQVLRDWTIKLDIYPKTCSAPIQMGQMMSIIAGGIILFGLIGILAFKWWQIRQDKIACDKFVVNSERNRMRMSTLAENPIYKSPISSYRMPEEYKGKDD